MPDMLLLMSLSTTRDEWPLLAAPAAFSALGENVKIKRKYGWFEAHI